MQNRENMKVAEKTEQDRILEFDPDDLEAVKQALLEGLEELQRFLDGKEDTTTNGRQEIFKRQGVNS